MLQNIKKLEGGSFETLKFLRKKFRTVPKKIERGLLVSSGFVSYVKKVKNEMEDPLR